MWELWEDTARDERKQTQQTTHYLVTEKFPFPYDREIWMCGNTRNGAQRKKAIRVDSLFRLVLPLGLGCSRTLRDIFTILPNPPLKRRAFLGSSHTPN